MKQKALYIMYIRADLAIDESLPVEAGAGIMAWMGMRLKI